MRASISQRAVGQGGLLCGEIASSTGTVSWIFDCGSNQIDPLVRELKQLSEKPFDLLFLSHLDNDHINGIDRLLQLRQVKEVVLPYLNSWERALLVAEAIEQENATPTFIEFALDGAGWLQQRGVDRVTFIRPGRPDRLEDGGSSYRPDPSPRPEKSEYSSPQILWSREDPAPKTTGVRIVPNGAVAVVAGTGASLDWIFVPYVHPPSAIRVRAFLLRLRLEFPNPLAAINAARTVAGREKLRRCYDQLWADHNLVSLSLYAGPTSKSKHWQGRYGTSGTDNQKKFRGHGVGWLTTGDAALSGTRRRSAFLRFYREYLPKVGVFVTPHHGAATSFDASLLTPMTRLRLGVAAAGPNGYGHPHLAVRQAVEASGSSFLQVSEDPASTLRARLKW